MSPKDEVFIPSPENLSGPQAVLGQSIDIAADLFADVEKKRASLIYEQKKTEALLREEALLRAGQKAVLAARGSSSFGGNVDDGRGVNNDGDRPWRQFISDYRERRRERASDFDPTLEAKAKSFSAWQRVKRDGEAHVSFY